MIIPFLLFIVLHTAIWFSTNYQFVSTVGEDKSFKVCLLLSIPISICGFYAAKYAYISFETAWSVKLFGFGIGYIVFPILTWLYLSENPFNTKTMVSILLAIAIIGIQLFYPNS